MEKYICKYENCNDKYMSMGYCDEHWQAVKATWTPVEMGNQ